MRKRPKAVPWEKVKRDLMKNPKFVEEYEKLQPEFAIAQAIIDARVNKKVSQQELAEKVGTGQAVISRLETANASPSLSLIKRVADALGLRAEIHLIPK